MIAWASAEIAAACAADHVGPGGDGPGPVRALVDSREAGDGDLFFGLPGDRVDGGGFADQAYSAGAWGVVVERPFAEQAKRARGDRQHLFVVDDALAALGLVANAWRKHLGASVIGVTGSTGKTSTKDILAALLAKSRSVFATPANNNTEIGLPLTILAAEQGTQVLVLEMAMRGSGQIATLAQIADPDVGCVVNVGPVHLEQLGSVEAVAAAKAELIAGLRDDAVAVVPADEQLLAPHLREGIETVTFGGDGDVRLLNEDSPDSMGVASGAAEQRIKLRIGTPAGEFVIRPGFDERYLHRNLLAAVACAQAIGSPVEGDLDVEFSALRGEVLELLGGVTLINDCYNANPVSMRAALDNLGRAKGKKLAVLGGMAELGDDSARFHHEVASYAIATGVDLLVAVGDLAGSYGDAYVGAIEHVATPQAAAHVVRSTARPGDSVLVKGSRSVGLEAVADILLKSNAAPGPETSGAARGS